MKNDPIDGIKLLVNEIRNDLNFLIELYETKPITKGLNFLELDYKGKSLKLFYKSSKLHLMIFDLINLINQLESVIEKNKTIFICGNAYFNESMLESLNKLRDDLKKYGKLNVDKINKTVLADLIKSKCLIESENEYIITRKGLVIDIAE